MEDWQRPSEALAKIAALTETPQMRVCGWCKHRHPKSETCAHYVHDPNWITGPQPTCRCIR